MVKAVPGILAQIIEQKKTELLDRDPEVEKLAQESIRSRRDFRAALLSRPLAVIAEIKKASPSRGVISEHFDPPAIASLYERGGAAALSVLTDQKYFQGSFEHLRSARRVTRLPVLRKDFTIDEYHVLEAAAHGADAILLIAAALDVRRLRTFRELADEYGMSALVEVHDEDELREAVDSGALIIGVNNRDLRTFEVSLDVSLRLAGRMPSNVIRVAESGIQTSDHVRALQRAGFRGLLVGEHLMRSGNPEYALRKLLS